MRRRLIGAALTAMLLVAMVPATAAAKPMEGVDCDQLEATDIAFFTAVPLPFENFGELISTLQRDDALFAELVPLFALFSTQVGDWEDPIVFESFTQTVTTHAKCGLHPLVPWLVNGLPPGRQ